MPKHYRGEALGSAMGLIRLLVTLRAVRDRADRGARQSRRQRHRAGRRPRRRRHRDRPRRAGHLRRSVRRARDHLRSPVPARRRDQLSTTASGTVEAIGLKSTRIRAVHRRGARSSPTRTCSTRKSSTSRSATISACRSRSASPMRPRPRRWSGCPTCSRSWSRPTAATAARAGFEAFGASSLDFAVSVRCARRAIGRSRIATRDRFADRRSCSASPRKGSRSPIRPRRPTPPRPTARIIMPYPEVQPVKRIDLRDDEKPATPEAAPKAKSRGAANRSNAG